MIRTCLLGLGRIGLGYDLAGSSGQVFTHAKACLLHPGIELAVAIDPSADRRGEFFAFTGKPASDSISTAGLEPGMIDLFIIATPTSVRQPVVAQCLALAPKAILLEKPLATNPSEGELILAACRDAGVKLYINYFRLFDPAFRLLPVFCQEQGLGSFLHGVCRYSRGVRNNASHFISLLLSWWGTPVELAKLGNAQPLNDSDANLPFRLGFPEGTCWFFPLTAPYDIGELDLFFSGGRLQLNDYGERISILTCQPDPLYSGYQRLQPAKVQPLEPQASRYQFVVLDAVVNDLLTNTSTHENATNALDTLRICHELLHQS